jgi:hypothetical protein
MTDWTQYVKTKTQANSLSGIQPSHPNTQEYLFITFIENWVAALCLLLIIFFFLGGVIADSYKLNCSSNFFDAGKVFMGVLVGIFTPRGSKK